MKRQWRLNRKAMEKGKTIVEDLENYFIDELIPASGPAPGMNAFEVFEGRWKTTGKILSTTGTPAVSIEGFDSYRWLNGGNFMLHQVDVQMGDEHVRAVELIMREKGSDRFLMHYFGGEGGTGTMHASCNGNEWKFESAAERFNGSFSSGGTILIGKWERNTGQGWVSWMEIELRRC